MRLIEKYNEDESISFDTYLDEELTNLTFKLDSIEEVTFQKCKFQHVVFRDLYMEQITFLNCEFVNCYFIHVSAKNIHFVDSKLTDVVFDDGKIRDLKIDDSFLQFCSFSKMKLNDVAVNARLLSVTFEALELSSCNFSTSSFEDFKVVELDCENVLFQNAKFISITGDITSFKGATLSMEQAIDLVIGMGIQIKEFL